MENLEKIIAKIMQEASEKSKFINDQANNIVKEFENSQSKIYEKKNLELIKNYEDNKKLGLERAKSSVELQAKKIILKAKQDSIKYIFNLLEKRVKNLSPDKQKEYIVNCLEKRQKQDNEILILPFSFKDLNISGYDVKYSDNIKTGFMIEKDGVFENNTLEALINFKRDEIENRIQNFVFNN